MLIAGCTDHRDTSLGPRSGINAEIVDGPHGGNPHFAFLPPLAPTSTPAGPFDPTYDPVVIICEWDGVRCASPAIATFSRTAGTGGELITVSTDDQQYRVSWRMTSSLVAGRVYRIRVLAEDTELGHADVIATAGSESTGAGDVFQLKVGRVLPIKFRIEQGTLPRASIIVPADGATIDIPGFARVTFPAGAFASSQPVKVVGTRTAETEGDFAATVPVPVSRVGEREIRINTGTAGPLTPVSVAISTPGMPSVWMQVFQTGGDDILDTFEPAPTQYDAATGEVIVQLPVEAFTNARAATGSYEAVIVVGTSVAVPPPSPGRTGMFLQSTGGPCELAPLEPPLNSLAVQSGFNFPAHKGTDYEAPMGEPVYAGRDGVVERIGWDLRQLLAPDPRSGLMVKGWGRYVRLRHDDGTSSLYAHMIESSTDFLEEGQRVLAGDFIGLSDNTGGSTGPHLHVEYRKADGTPVNPADCLQPLGSVGGLWLGSWAGLGSNGTRLQDDWVIELFQNGTAVSGTVFSPYSGVSADLTGTMSGNVLDFSFTAAACCWMAYHGTGVLIGTSTMSMSGETTTSWGEVFTWAGSYTKASGAAALQSSRSLAPQPAIPATTSVLRGGVLIKPLK